MEMDTPEQQVNNCAKRTRVRLASPRKQLERTIQKMTKLSESPMKPEKQADLLTTMAGVQAKLLDIDRDAKLDTLIEAKEQLQSELAAVKTQSDDAIQRMQEQINGERFKKEAGLKMLNLQITTLQGQNAELATTNDGLKAKSSQLAEEVKSLQLTNSKLQVRVAELESRTPLELLAEARAKGNM
jgi:chromosome segregation ATPase